MSVTPVLDRHYWRERAAAILPSATPREIVRGARLLAAQYDEPTVTFDWQGSTLPAWVRGTIDADAFNGRDGGGVPDESFSGIPDAYRSRQHEMRGDGTVGKRGRARVQGSVSSLDDLPNGATPALLAQMLRDLPRNSVGALAWDVADLTHLFYSPDPDLPELLGTDTVAYRQVVHAHPLADPYTARGVVGRDSAVCKVQTWPTRYRLPSVRIRKSERGPAGMLPAPAEHRGATVFDRAELPAAPGTREFVCTGRNRAIVCGYIGYWRDTLAVEKVTDHAGNPVTFTTRLGYTLTDMGPRIWVGHRNRGRGNVAPRKSRVALESRTIGTVEIERPDTLATVAECLNRGERVVVKLNGTTLTLTRGKSDAGTFSLTTPAGKASGMRTPANVVKRATELVA